MWSGVSFGESCGIVSNDYYVIQIDGGNLSKTYIYIF